MESFIYGVFTVFSLAALIWSQLYFYANL